MENKDIEKILKNIREITEILGNDDFNEIKNVEISIKKNADGTAVTKIDGDTIAILITLAGLEKTILKQLNVPKEVWELIKHKTGVREAK